MCLPCSPQEVLIGDPHNDRCWCAEAEEQWRRNGGGGLKDRRPDGHTPVTIIRGVLPLTSYLLEHNVEVQS